MPPVAPFLIEIKKPFAHVVTKALILKFINLEQCSGIVLEYGMKKPKRFTPYLQHLDFILQYYQVTQLKDSELTMFLIGLE